MVMSKASEPLPECAQLTPEQKQEVLLEAARRAK
jgi:hypothetical protein